MESPTKILADFVVRTSFDDIPKNAIHQTKRLILDTLGCAISGSVTKESKIVLDLILELGGQPQSTLIGDKHRTSSAHASYVNAKTANILDFDECLLNYSHPGSPTVCSSLSIGEPVNATGKDLLTAVALGYDIAARVGLSAGRPKAGVSTAYGYGWVALGATTGVSKILNLDRDEVINAFGITGNYAPSPSNFKFVDGPETMVKYCDSGWAAMGGSMAALLAKRGHTGCPTILDGETGFWRFFNPSGDECDCNILIGELGKKWYIVEGMAFKPYPCCRWLHPAIDILTGIIKEHALRPQDIDRITIKSHIPLKPIFVNYEPLYPMDTSHSIPYNVAVAAFGVRPGHDWPRRERDPAILKLASRVRVIEDPRAKEVVMNELSIYKGGFKKAPTTVEVIVNGKTFGHSAEYAKGDPWTSETAMTDEELKEKFRENASWKLDSDVIKEIIEEIYSLEKRGDIASLITLCA